MQSDGPMRMSGTFVAKKCWREYELDENGQKIPTKKGNDYKSHKVYATDWNDKGNVEKWRALWADIETDFYKKNGYEITAEHRSFERQRIGLLPTIHMGAAVTAMERRGIQTEVGDMNREIKKVNALIISSMENIERLTNKIAFLEKEKKVIEREEEKEAQTQESKQGTLISILMEWQQNRSAFIQDNNIRQRMDTKAGNIKDFSVMVSFLQSHKIETALSYRTGLKNMSGTGKLLPKTWKKELDVLKAESAGIKHDLAENDAILGELAEIADKAAMV